MPTYKTNFPKGHTRKHYVTKNMSAEYLAQARRVAGFRAAAGLKGSTVESVILDCLGASLGPLEAEARARLTKEEKP